ncbi:MAG TPA: hypothetical protein VIY49_19125 [Bryobacteraceae bacterium]
MNAGHNRLRTALIFPRPLHVVLADDLRRIAQNVGGILDGAALHEDLRGQGVTEAMRVSVRYAAFGEDGLQRPNHCFDVTVASARAAPKEVFGLGGYALGKRNAFQSA